MLDKSSLKLGTLIVNNDEDIDMTYAVVVSEYPNFKQEGYYEDDELDALGDIISSDEIYTDIFASERSEEAFTS